VSGLSPQDDIEEDTIRLRTAISLGPYREYRALIWLSGAYVLRHVDADIPTEQGMVSCDDL